MKYFLKGATLVTRNIMITGHILFLSLGFSGGSVIKNVPFNTGNMSSIPGLGRFPGKGNGNPVQYSCLGNLMDRRA